jgi:hypothetical protein
VALMNFASLANCFCFCSVVRLLVGGTRLSGHVFVAFCFLLDLPFAGPWYVRRKKELGTGSFRVGWGQQILIS